MSLPPSLESRYRTILSKVEHAPQRVTLIAVSKAQPLEKIQALYALGQRDFGESYVQELIQKANALHTQGIHDIRWHFIGHLQTNKVKTLLPVVHSIHSVDSERLAAELAKRRMSNRLPIFLEVNIDEEPSKSGFAPQQVAAAAAAISQQHPLLEIRGLMCIPSAERTDLAGPFHKLRELSQRCGSSTAGDLSMGMSDDYKVAIEAGATHLRVGTVLFGERN